jgi:hypothetical protein
VGAGTIDANEQAGSTSWVFLLLVPGNLVGTAVFAIGWLAAARCQPGRRC